MCGPTASPGASKSCSCSSSCSKVGLGWRIVGVLRQVRIAPHSGLELLEGSHFAPWQALYACSRRLPGSVPSSRCTQAFAYFGQWVFSRWAKGTRWVVPGSRLQQRDRPCRATKRLARRSLPEFQANGAKSGSPPGALGPPMPLLAPSS
jgi:hypothetical protein